MSFLLISSFIYRCIQWKPVTPFYQWSKCETRLHPQLLTQYAHCDLKRVGPNCSYSRAFWHASRISLTQKVVICSRHNFEISGETALKSCISHHSKDSGRHYLSKKKIRCDFLGFFVVYVYCPFYKHKLRHTSIFNFKCWMLHL